MGRCRDLGRVVAGEAMRSQGANVAQSRPKRAIGARWTGACAGGRMARWGSGWSGTAAWISYTPTCRYVARASSKWWDGSFGGSCRLAPLRRVFGCAANGLGTFVARSGGRHRGPVCGRRADPSRHGAGGRGPTDCRRGRTPVRRVSRRRQPDAHLIPAPARGQSRSAARLGRAFHRGLRTSHPARSSPPA